MVVFCKALRPRRILWVVLMLLLIGSRKLPATDQAQRSPTWLDPTGITGKLVIVGGGEIPPEAITFFVSAVGDQRLIVITTADQRAGEQQYHQQVEQLWRSRLAGEVHVLHAQTREQASSQDFIQIVESAGAIWFEGGDQSRLAERYVDTAFEQQLAALLKQGGVIGGTSAGAAIMSREMIAGGNPQPEMSRGLDLLPDAIVDQHFRERQRQVRLSAALQLHPGRFGVGVDERTALLIEGRQMQIVGQGAVTFATAGTATRAPRTWLATAGLTADLTAWRRAARQVFEAPFPASSLQPPQLASGSLVIVGGGRLPEEILQRFIQLAGGPESLIVVLPTALGDVLPSEDPVAGMFAKAGAKNVKVMRARRPEEIETAENLDMLGQARGIWFGGGRQWRFVDAFEGTVALPLFHDVLQRGGVIGGTSAGASIQAEYMVRGNPLGNTDMMAIGYERGFGFLPGVAIDQHFTQRNRFEDLLSVTRTYPQLLGIGIDEGTALVVQGSRGDVIGDGGVHFCQGRQADDQDTTAEQFVHVPHGSSFDLVRREPCDKNQ